MNSFEHQETMRPRDWSGAQGIYWKNSYFEKNKFLQPHPSFLVLLSHGEMPQDPRTKIIDWDIYLKWI